MASRIPRFSLLLLASLATACRDRPKTVEIGTIVIDAPPKHDNDDAFRKQLRARIRAQLANDPTVEWVKRAREESYRLHLVVHPVVNHDDGEIRPLEVRLHGPDGSVQSVGRGPAEASLVDSVIGGFNEVWPVLTRMRTLEVSKDAAVIEALGDADPRIRGFAIRRLGDRRVRDALAPLCALLTNESRQDLVLQAVGSLVAIGDEAAVKPLIDITYQKDHQFVTQVVFAVAAIGGRNAEAFLVTLAGGHPNKQVQQAATDALNEMSRRTRRKQR